MRDEDERKVLEKELKRWEETTLRDALASHPERRKEFVTTSSRPVKRLYTPLDLAGKTDRERLGSPGEFPFTRGIHPTMYRGRLGTMRMFAGYGSAEDTNRRFKDLISHRGEGLSVAFDMPTPYGHDTHGPGAQGGVGGRGGGGPRAAGIEVPFPGGDGGGGGEGGPGARLHPDERHGVRPLADRPGPEGRRVRAPAVLLLQRAQRFVRGVGQVPRGPPHLGPRDAGHLRGEEASVVAVALPYPDRRGQSDGAAAGDQHRPDDDPGARGGARGGAGAPHECVRGRLSNAERYTRA